MFRGFEVEKFINRLLINNGSVRTSAFARGLCRNVVYYGLENEHVSKDQFIDWLVGIIPGLSVKDVLPYMADECLSEGYAALKKTLPEI